MTMTAPVVKQVRFYFMLQLFNTFTIIFNKNSIDKIKLW